MNFNRKTPRIFYGWWLVIGCFFIWLLQGGFILLGFTAFFDPIAEEFGWSYTQVSLAASLRGIETSLLAPVLGVMVDRFGPRRLMFGGMIIICLGFLMLGLMHSLAVYYFAFALIAIGLSGSSPTVAITAIANWFHRRVSLATGIIGAGFALGGLVVPMVVLLIDKFGWRDAVFILLVVTLVVNVPLSLLFRHKPEQYGYLPDGELRSTTLAAPAVSVPTVKLDMGVRQAMRSRAFWQISIALVLLQLTVNAVIVHVMPFLGTVGIMRSVASLVAMGVSLSSGLGRLGAGMLGDRLNKKHVTTASLVCSTLGLLAFHYVTPGAPWLLWTFMFLFGLGWGGIFTMRAGLIAEYFGRANFGTVLGIMLGMSSVGSFLGPVLAGWAFDAWGSYGYFWLELAGLAFLGVIIMVTTPPPGDRTVKLM
ncbi:MAG: MFS transporter [Chloroflexota bacterium]